ncbi:DUF6402 family protein [Archangium violaceum]|uniref:DUF6402 family protein n=1 Tax=Archangium violaceum TaxID=83451 RepID=UPI0026BA2C06
MRVFRPSAPVPASCCLSAVRYFRVMNRDDNAYRRRTGKGDDFMVFSTVKRVPVSIQVHLSGIDFDEYLGRKGG